mgnify:CR=1 FL=1
MTRITWFRSLFFYISLTNHHYIFEYFPPFAFYSKLFFTFILYLPTIFTDIYIGFTINSPPISFAFYITILNCVSLANVFYHTKYLFTYLYYAFSIFYISLYHSISFFFKILFLLQHLAYHISLFYILYIILSFSQYILNLFFTYSFFSFHSHLLINDLLYPLLFCLLFPSLLLLDDP